MLSTQKKYTEYTKQLKDQTKVVPSLSDNQKTSKTLKNKKDDEKEKRIEKSYFFSFKYFIVSSSSAKMFFFFIVIRPSVKVFAKKRIKN